jgi:hypothetical protein
MNLRDRSCLDFQSGQIFCGPANVRTMSALSANAEIRDVFRRDLLNRFFNETESRFGAACAILPLFQFDLELVDRFFGGSKLTPNFLWRISKYLLYATTPRLRSLLPRGGVFEVGNQLLKKCHLAAPETQPQASLANH